MAYAVYRKLYILKLQYASKDLGFRLGSDRDRDNLAETFKMLGFHVEIYENLTYRKLMETVVNISRYDFSNYDALVFCLLSHGKRDSIYSSDSIEVPVDVIRTHFDGIHCRTLCRKPKLFFVQACKGEIHHGNLFVFIIFFILFMVLFFYTGSVKSDDYEQDSGIVSPNAPVVCNFFEAWATIPGYVAYRSKYSGKPDVLPHFKLSYALPVFRLLIACRFCLYFDSVQNLSRLRPCMGLK